MFDPGTWLVAGLLMTTQNPTSAGDRIAGQSFATRSPTYATHGMVCTSQPLAAQIGLAVLKEGGSAVDAAIATNAALGLMEPTSNGIGGDLFALLWDNKAQELVALNGSGRSPLAGDLEQLKALLEQRGEDAIPMHGALPVSVPGCVDGWFTLHERYGKLPMSRLLEPTIRYAREGFPVSQIIAAYWRRAESSYDGHEEFSRVYLPGGRAPREGEMFRNPDLADTLELIAKGGRKAFYEGAVAESIVAAVQADGGWLALQDLEQHRSEWVTPVAVPYRGHQLWELPPNGQGIAALQMLRILSDYGPGAEGTGFWSDEGPQAWNPLAWHRLIEAKKLVYEDRARYYADPHFAAAPLDHLLSAEYAAERRARIDDSRSALHQAPGEVPIEHGDTIYLTVADDEGNVVSWIQSNYAGFGSGLVPEGCGFGLQNRGKLFNLDPEHANAYAPGKRPFHTIIPAMLTRDGLPVLAFGVMGGAMQPQGHVQIVVNMLDHGMNVQEAGDAPRWRHSGSSQPDGGVMTDGGVVHLESGVPLEIRDALKALGHEISVHAGGFGGYQAIWIDDITGVAGGRLYQGASESRKDGAAVGW
jgi:gamma-glutamyltranspeptidase/glutathione hydrolase